MSFGQNKYSTYIEKDVNSYTKSNLLNDVSKTFRDLAKQNEVKREMNSDQLQQLNQLRRRWKREKDSIKFLKKNNKYVRFKCKDRHPNDKIKIKACKRLKRRGYL